MRVLASLFLAVVFQFASPVWADSCKNIEREKTLLETAIVQGQRALSTAQGVVLRLQNQLTRKQKKFEKIEPFCAGDLSVSAPESYLAALTLCHLPQDAEIARRVRRRACGLVARTEKQLPEKTKQCREEQAVFTAYQKRMVEQRIPAAQSKEGQAEEKLASLQADLSDLEARLQGCRQEPETFVMDFEDIPIATMYPIGQGPYSEPVRVQLSPLYYEQGVSADQFASFPDLKAIIHFDGFMGNKEGPPNHMIGTHNVNLQLHLPKCASSVSFEYYGGRGDILNFIAEDQLLILKHGFEELNQARFQTVAVRTTVRPVIGPYEMPNGLVTVAGNCIRGLAFGGQEILFDNITITY